MDEGLYAFTNDRGIRQWHAAVKEALGKAEPSAVRAETLQAAIPRATGGATR